MAEYDDPLPTGDDDPELRRLQALLAPLAARTRLPAEWQPRAAPAGRRFADDDEAPIANAAPARAPSRRRWRGWLGAAGAALAASLLVFAGLQYRLAWDDGAPWRVTASAADAPPAWVAPGDTLQTGAGESLAIRVARIGHVDLAPESRARLVETRRGRHRLELDQGHLRARIWAPPGWFSVSGAGWELMDLGCEFEVWKHADGSGRVLVHSGWIAYRVGRQDLLLPAGYAADFSHERVLTPLRPAADPAFVATVRTLEHALATDPGASGDATRAAADAVAAAASDSDAYTLLSVLTEHPRLADGALYPRLAAALGIDGDAAHRAAWARGELPALNRWWRALPTQPKAWWANWRDAFG
jgi:hypothetical protein